MSLAKIRNDRKLTQEQLEAVSGVNQTTISALETGKNKKPSWDTVSRLSTALGISPYELFPIVDSTAVTDEGPAEQVDSVLAGSTAQAVVDGEGPREGGAE